MIYISITHALMALLQCFAQFSTLLKSAPDVFAQKNFPKDIKFPNLLQIRLISNWTSCRTIQGEIMPVISN